MIHLIFTIWFILFLNISASAQTIKIKKPDPVLIEIEEVQQETAAVMQGNIHTSRILTPTEGEIVGKVVRVRGVVKRPGGSAWLQVNDMRQPVHLQRNGLFKEVVILTSGENRIALGAGSHILDVIHIISNAPKSALRVQLTWEADKADIDLYVTQPDQSTIWFGHMRSNIGWLDVDDTYGFGPEHFTLETHVHGTFHIAVHYYATHGWWRSVPYCVTILKDDRVFHTYEGVLPMASASIRMAGPRNIGRGKSWQYVTNITLP